MRLFYRFLLIVPWLILVFVGCVPPNNTPVETATLPPPTPSHNLEFGDGSDLLDRVLERGVLRVGVRVWPDSALAAPVFRGASNAATGGALTGFEVDIAQKLAQQLGLELELVEANPAFLLTGAWQNQWDIALGAITPFDQPLLSAQQPIFYSKSYGYLPMGMLVAQDNTDISGLVDLANKRLAVINHSAYQAILAPRNLPLTVQGQPLSIPLPPETEQVAVSSLSLAIERLGQVDEIVEANQENQHLDALFGPTPMLEQAISSGWAVKFAPHAVTVGYQPVSVAVVSQDGLKVDRLLQEINRVLAQMDQDSDLLAIYLTWYDQDFSRVP
ncbi:transporter substrate-binding domain-containing protein [Anaerolineales bacterium HSG25]|nr:transporter substrate-binding domain-containing protein [Anaerolineales bacterium HSG25]